MDQPLPLLPSREGSRPRRGILEPKPNNPYGLYVVYQPEDRPVIMDIILIHGLGGKSYDTWREKDCFKPEVFWPRSLHEIKPLQRVRVSTFGYDTASFKKMVGYSAASIPDFALDLLSRLRSDGEDDVRAFCFNSSLLSTARFVALLKSLTLFGTQIPVMFVAHSMGGLVFKQVGSIRKIRENCYYQQIMN